MVLRRLLLLLKPLDAYPLHLSNGMFNSTDPKMSKILNYLDTRRSVHAEAIKFCGSILSKKQVYWEPISRSNLSGVVRDVDLVVTIGGDGTLLQASHFLDSSIPVLGVNSDPTKDDEVAEFRDEFDATRSTGYLCKATVKNFEQVLDDILENRTVPSDVTRMSVSLNSQQLPTYAMNDVLIAHPCPATVSRFSFRVCKNGEQISSLLHTRSSGLRVSTAAGSTAAMLSAGGFVMPILSKDLQYMVREPIAPTRNRSLMHGAIDHEDTMEIGWFSKEGMIYIDGSHVAFSVRFGDTIELSSSAPTLKVFLPSQLSM